MMTSRLMDSKELPCLHDSVRERFMSWDEFMSLPNETFRKMLPDEGGAAAEIMRLGRKRNTETKGETNAG